MPFVAVRNVAHYYEWITSRGETPTGKPVMVFVHGWGGSARYWEATARRMSDRFDCLLYDLRGFGRSHSKPAATPDFPFANYPKDYSVDSYAADLLALFEVLHLDRVWLHAHSMGTSIATVFLAQHSARVEQAILTCGGIFKYEKLAFAAFHRFGGYVVKLRPAWLSKIPFANRMFMARFLHQALPDGESQAFLEDYLMADQAAALGTLYSVVSQQAAEEMPSRFRAIDVPTLLLSGEHDIIIPPELGANAAQVNPQRIQYEVLAGTAHFPMLEDPIAYQRCVDQFLGRNDGDLHFNRTANAPEEQSLAS